MPAVTYPITVEQGATYDLQVTWTEPDGTAISLAGYTAHMQIRDDPSGALLIDLTSGGGLTVEPDGQTGVITIRLGADQTALLTGRGGRYDLELHMTGDETEVVRLMSGKVSVSEQVTQP